MSENYNKRVYGIIGGVFFLLCGLLNLYSNIMLLIAVVPKFEQTDMTDYLMYARTLAPCAIMLLIGVLLLCDVRKTITFAGFAAYAVLNAGLLMYDHSQRDSMGNVYLIYILSAVAYVLAAIIVGAATCKPLFGLSSVTSKLWLAPAILIALFYLSLNIYYATALGISTL